MSRHTPPLPFSPYYDFHVVKPLTIGGQTLKLGDPLPKDGVSPRRLRQLFEARMISVLPPEVLPINGATGAAHGDNGAWGSNSPDGIAKAPSGPLRAHHKGFGKWYVLDAAGDEISGPHAREEAERLANV
jgi:hypothetical protein